LVEKKEGKEKEKEKVRGVIKHDTLAPLGDIGGYQPLKDIVDWLV